MKTNLYFTLFIMLFAISGYCQPAFTGGHSQSLSICENSSTLNINSFLIVSDPVSGKTETWSVVIVPKHGTAGVSYATLSTGGTLTPTGTTYKPTFGYTGNDSFKVKVSDGTKADTTTIYVTVNTIPKAIAGGSSICTGISAPFSDAISGGTWTSSNIPVIAIGSSSGVATASTTGTATITYSLTGGCITTTVVTVKSMPAGITGTGIVCAGYITALSDATGGGTWSSSNTTIATVSAGGLLTGISAGTSTITYETGIGCAQTKTATVNPVSPITGPAFLCPGLTTTLSTAIAGGTWTSSNPSIAVVFPTTGDAIGLAPGTVYITYTLPTGCISTKLETVNPAPALISGSSVCIGSAATLSDATPGGTWFCDNPAVATIGSGSGVLSGIAIGTATVSYTLTTTGCMTSETIVVNPLPTVYTVYGGGSYCSGASGVHIYLTFSDPGTEYYLHNTGITIGPFAGTGTLLDFGLQTLAGTFTATATDMITGCGNLMSGSASIVIIPNVTPSLSVSSSYGDTICGGVTNNYLATPVNGGLTPSYQWVVNGLTVGIDTPNYNYIPANGDTIIVRLVSNAICATPDTVFDTTIMTVIPHVMPSVSLAAWPGTEICMPNAVTFTAIPYYGGPAPSYFYMKNGAVIDTGNKFSYKPSDGDVFYCYMVSDFSCRLADTVYGTISIKVDTPVIPSFQIAAYPPVFTAPGQAATMTAIVTNCTGPFTYQWIINDSIMAGATYDTFTSNYFTYTDNDSVSCIVKRLGICEMTTFNWRKMLNNVGVRQLSPTGQFTVFPNPSKGTIIIKGSQLGIDEEITAELTDMVGQVVYKKSFIARNGNMNETIQPGTLANGMYLLNLRSEGGNKVFHVVIEE